MSETRNRLAETTSPYLQQHADNPVHWWPWCREALETARRENKPILLSIGYSACHWCHVMAHESFENEDTARLMNELFVNIKVDREERPDLDKIYQNAHYLLSQRPGGWPLTIFLTPDDQTPFYSGTYFPPEPRHGLPGFATLLVKVAQAFREQGEAIAQQAQSLKDALAQLSTVVTTPGVVLEMSPFDRATQTLGKQFDPRHGGFGQAPKFPHPDNIALLLHAGQTQAQPLQQASFTLERMALGGLNDQLGGGFYRYSVDEQWMIPHFEKMLYDNGLLLTLYADAWLVTGNPVFRRACETTAGWTLREMQSPQGGYWSSLDADSEGEEGKFYVWKRDELRSLLSDEEYGVFASLFGLDRNPNFEGQWHLHRFESMEKIAAKRNLAVGRVQELVDSARDKLFTAREQRARPGRDDKILTSWNALMIRGMARAGRLLGRPEWVDSAEQALDFIHRELWRDGRLLAVHKDGVSHLAAYLDDYAWLIQALLEILQCRWDSARLLWALELAEVMLARYQDREEGGFYFTADDHEQLIQRPRSFTDDATPSGNGIAAQVLLELAHLSGEMRYLEAAERTLKAAWGSICQTPHAHASLVLALKKLLQPGDLIIVRGAEQALPAWQAVAVENFRLERSLYAIPESASDLPEPLRQRQAKGAASAWLCRGKQCQPPVRTPEQLLDLLSA